MRQKSLVTLFLTAMAGIACGADPALEAFARQYVKAEADGDTATLEAMTYMEGTSPEDFNPATEISRPRSTRRLRARKAIC